MSLYSIDLVLSTTFAEAREKKRPKEMTECTECLTELISSCRCLWSFHPVRGHGCYCYAKHYCRITVFFFLQRYSEIQTGMEFMSRRLLV